MPRLKKPKAPVPRNIISPRLRITKKVYVKLTAAEKQRRSEAASEKRDEIRQAVDAWLEDIVGHAQTLADRFKKKPRYFLNMLFQNNIRMSKKQTKTNSFNAWKSEKALELKEAGEPPMDVEDLVATYRHEYDALNEKQKAETVHTFETRRQIEEWEKIKFPTLKSRIRSAAEIVHAIVELLKVAKLRCGIEAMFLMVRSDPDPFMDPKWFWTNPNWIDYMKAILRQGRGFDPKIMAAKLESFSIAGCDPNNMLKTVDDQSKWYKTLIREEMLSRLLDAVNEGSTLKMDFTTVPYEKFDKLVTFPHGVVVNNWPFPQFQNPSKLSNTVEPLKELYNGLRNGSIGFKRLSEGEHKEWVTKYEEGLKSGVIQVKARRVRSDAGKKRGPQKGKRKRTEPDVGREDGEWEDVGSEDEEEEDAEEEWTGISGGDDEHSVDVEDERPHKRTKTAAAKSAAKTKTSKKPSSKPPRASKSTTRASSKSKAKPTSVPVQEEDERREGAGEEMLNEHPSGHTPSPNNDSFTDEPRVSPQSASPLCPIPPTRTPDEGNVEGVDGDQGGSKEGGEKGVDADGNRDGNVVNDVDVDRATSTRRAPQPKVVKHFGDDWPGRPAVKKRKVNGGTSTKKLGTGSNKESTKGTPKPKPVGKAAEDRQKGLQKDN
ncbi:hypothetical protein VNI00_011733 [Paramarasmius palmivorus]|uniref:Uncharacterized protein n=1 Tax=Paramarasmius palmivorus TaxID=297713 RepID=A0AAW0CDJ4_9AGAR